MTVAHRYGSTEIKSGPARVVTLGLSDQDAALALGVKPVGALSFNTVLSIPYAIDQAVPILAGGNSK
ncbi:hypothetical protein Phou_072910 [Phytohabitans houttuyneae]|uniref:Uncharacterized protein n=1 Tax=Phytohabitans houttuyneae TaxID=1076126 RepID=A0A6V8KL11_9ACTN|nr:hypothetical protein Phou_072910 [Phytohabitans houttuyneae]